MPSVEPLLDATCRLLRDCPRDVSYAMIAKGADVTTSWLSDFARNAIPDPGVRKVQRLHDYLRTLGDV